MALCRVTGTLYLPTGEPASNYIIFLSRTDARVVADYNGTVVPQVVKVQSRSNGEVDFGILTGGYQGLAKAATNVSGDGFEFTFGVPEASSVKFEDCVDAVAPALPTPLWMERVVAQVDANSAAISALDVRVEALEAGGGGTAPVVTVGPSITPLSPVAGDSVTVSWGSASGSPAPTLHCEFLMDGSDASSQLTGNTFVAQEGQYSIGGEWRNAAGTAPISPLAVVVQAAPTPPINYDTQLLAYFNADTPITGAASDVESILARGTAGAVYTKTGTGAAVERVLGVQGGFKFSDGVYMQSQNFTGLPTTDGMFAVMSFTLTSYGSNQGLLLDGAGGHLKLRNNGGAMQFLAQDDNAVTVGLGSVAYGTRFTVAGEVDDVTDLMRAFNLAGSLINHPTPHGGMTDPALGRLVHGRYVNGVIHEFGIVGKPEGGAWPVTMEELFADFTRGA